MSAEIESSKQMNFYLNSGILIVSFFVIIYLMKKNNANRRDEDNYDWSKYTILSEQKYKNKKSDKKDKVKPRVKEYSKGTGFVKEEHKFSTAPIDNEKKYLNAEEKINLNDMINMVADKTDSYPIESLYSGVKKTSYNYLVNEEIDQNIQKLLASEDPDKNKKILENYALLLNSEKNVLTDKTYLALIEFFIKNSQLNYASYFLCQLDKLQIAIPRQILDLFLDSSIAQKIFEKPEEKKEIKEKRVNKFDQYDLGNYPDYLFYSNKRQNYKKREESLKRIYSKLKVEAEPFFPKSAEKKSKLADIDISKVKEFYPKNYKVVSRENTNAENKN